MDTLDNKNNASKRKTDHIDLAFKSQTDMNLVDNRFFYEPMLGNINEIDLKTNFLKTRFDAPIWISSMTGGTGIAANINKNLAKACHQFGLGMGLGSCRQLLDNHKYINDFKVREYIGDRPLYANLGIAQVEELIFQKQTNKIKELINILEADGVIVHVNPMQEFTQPEGDKLLESPIVTIKRLIDKSDFKIIVKEVGQGMGYHSLKELLQLPLTAIEFAAYGGTNFAKLELLRNTNSSLEQYSNFISIGHSANEMVDFINRIKDEIDKRIICRDIIISGGIKSFLDGYYLTEKIESPAIYGMASKFLEYATGEYGVLEEFISNHIEGLKMAKAFLRIKK